MNTNEHNNQPESDDSIIDPIIGLPGDERDVLISRIIDGVATSNDWNIFRAVAAHDPSIWSELAGTQRMHQTLSETVEHHVSIADAIELPGGLINDQPMRAKMDFVSRWGGWAAAAAILLVWFFGKPVMMSQPMDSTNQPAVAGIPGMGVSLKNAQPNQAFDQYLSSGLNSGQVIGEMPERIVIETRPMADGTIEVLYLRQIIERQIIDHAYREVQNETGQVIPVPVQLSPTIGHSY